MSQESELQFILRGLMKNKLSLVGGIIVVIYFITAILVAAAGNLITPYDPYAQDLMNQLQPPSLAHPFGTDNLGRDIFSRVLAGTPIDAGIALLVVLVSAFVGGFFGALAGSLGGILDEIVMRITDIFLSFPSLVLAIAVSMVLGPGIIQAAMSLIVVWWPWYTRLARGEALVIKSYPYVEAARAAGLREVAIVFRHILPNIFSPLLIYATIDIGNVVMTAAMLSFIGLGAQPPLPEWGRMVFEGQDYLFNAWWFPVMPGIAIFIVTLAFSLLGDGLRDVLDPRMRYLRY